jgi:hypothetical protein
MFEIFIKSYCEQENSFKRDFGSLSLFIFQENNDPFDLYLYYVIQSRKNKCHKRRKRRKKTINRGQYMVLRS